MTLYYECHITIDPIFDEELEVANEIVSKHKFKMAKLLMQKGREDIPEISKRDTFTTGHGSNKFELTKRMIDVVRELRLNGFVVRRYKIEDVILDSRINDEVGLLTEEGYNERCIDVFT